MILAGQTKFCLLFAVCGMTSQNKKEEAMNLARHSRQLFPLILGNSRTVFSAIGTRSISTTKPQFTKEELDINLHKNPYYAKYGDKIQKLKETNPEEYFKRIEAIKKLAEKPSDDESSSSTLAETKKETAKSLSSRSTEKKGLDSIMKLEMLSDKLPSEITELWKSYYKDKDAVYAVVPADLYKKVSALRKENPIFIYPLPRKDGYEMFLGQFTKDDCHFTSLIQYQKHQENAPIQFVVNHYTELIESKGIVLMSGRLMDEAINVTDAQLLSYQMQYFYNEDNYKMVEDFNKSPNEFNFNRIIECIGEQLLNQQRKS